MYMETPRQNSGSPIARWSSMLPKEYSTWKKLR